MAKINADKLAGEAETLPNPVINRGLNISKPAPSDADYVPEDEKLDGIDLVKINEIISSADMQKGGYIRLERRGPLDQNYQYVAKIKPEDFDIDRVMKLYGGGDYNGRTFRANGQMYKMFTFSIDHRKKGALDESDIKQLASAEAGKSSEIQAKIWEAALNRQPASLETNPGFMTKVLEMATSKKDETTPLMLTMIQQMQTQSTQQMQLMMTAMQESNKMMIALMTATKSSGPDASLAILMEILKEKATGDPVEKLMKLMQQAKDLVAGAPSEKEPSMLQQIVAGAAPAVASLFMGKQAQSPAPGVEVIDHGPKPVIQPSEEQMNQAAIRVFLSQVLNAASRNSDQGIYVDMIFDNLNEEQLLGLQRNLTDASWPVNVFGDDPRAAQFRPWLDRMKTMILEELNNAATQSPATDLAKSDDIAGSRPAS